MISVLRRGTKVLFLLPMILPKRFDIFPPLTEGCSEGLDAFRFFFKQYLDVCMAIIYIRVWINGETTFSDNSISC